MTTTSDKEDDVPSIAKEVLAYMRRRFGPVADRLFLLGLVVIAVVTLLYTTFDSWKGLVWSSPSLEIVSVSSHTPGLLIAVLRNRATTPLVITAVALEVKEARETYVGLGQGSSIPVMATFDAMLTPQRGLVVPVGPLVAQIGPNAVEQVEIRVGSRAQIPPARLDYTLAVQVTYDEMTTISSVPARMQVFALPQP